MKRNHLSLAIGLTLLMGLGAAQAQDAAPAEEGSEGQPTTLETVEVTARRRTESLQEVPVAVSAFSEDDLKDLQATNVDGLQGAVPNMNIVQGRGSSNSVNVFIRGIGQPDALQTFDPGVGMYVDDVYFSRINGALFSLFDVARVEVLRGPQGTLYGKNSTGGAIKIVTRDPSLDADSVGEFTVGDNGRFEGRFYGAARMNDTVSASLAAVGLNTQGYVTDPLTGIDYNEEDTVAARLKVAVNPSEAFSASFSLDHTHQDNNPTLGNPEAPLTQTDLGLGTIVLLLPDAGEYDFESSTSLAPGQRQELDHSGLTASLRWDFAPSWTAKSITAYRKLETASFIDIDASPLQIGDVFVGLDQKQFSQELQLQYNTDTVSTVFGLYYLREDVPSEQMAFADDFIGFFGAPVDFLRTIDDDLETTSKAAFVHGSWEFSPGWTVSAGLRYTDETKDYFRTTSTFWGAPLQAFNSTFAFNASDSWSALTPSFSLQRQINDGAMAYFSANRGFKSGGFNGRANSATEVSAFDPEFVWTYEMGLKLQSEDRRLLGNFSVFRSNYEDFQARVSEVTNPGAPVPNFTFPVLNAAKLRIDGVEFEGVALVGDGTRLSAQVGWLDARYVEFEDPRVALNPALADLHDHVPFSPEWTARLAASHTFMLSGGGMFTVAGDVSYRADTWLSVDNRDVLKQDAYTLVGAYVVYDTAGGDWQFRLGVRNLTDEVYKTDAQEFSSVGNIQTAYYGAPRNAYFSARFNF